MSSSEVTRGTDQHSGVVGVREALFCPFNELQVRSAVSLNAGHERHRDRGADRVP